MIIAFIVIALPILLMAGVAAMAAVLGREGGTLSVGTVAWMVVALAVLIGAAAALVRVGTKA